MQIVAQSLLVLKLTHGSAFALGCVSLSQAVAFFLFALVGGGIADRVNRRRLLLVTQTSLMLLAGLLGFLTVTGAINVWLIALFAFLSGTVLSFDQPARAALISTLVPQEDLLSAISLQSAVFNGAAVAGPVLAGITVDFIGLPANFFLNAFSYAAVLLALVFLPAPTAVSPKREKLSLQIRTTLKCVRGDPVLLRLICVYGVLLFAGPSLPLLIPVLAAARLHVGATTLGILFSAAGIGAVAGSIILGSLPVARSTLARAAVATWCIALTLTGIGRTLQVTFCALALLGASQSIVGATTAALLQTSVPPQQRARAMSLNTLLLMGLRPLGDFPCSIAIAVLGAPAAAVVGAVIVAASALVAFARKASNRQAEPQRASEFVP